MFYPTYQSAKNPMLNFLQKRKKGDKINLIIRKSNEIFWDDQYLQEAVIASEKLGCDLSIITNYETGESKDFIDYLENEENIDTKRVEGKIMPESEVPCIFKDDLIFLKPNSTLGYVHPMRILYSKKLRKRYFYWTKKKRN